MNMQSIMLPAVSPASLLLTPSQVIPAGAGGRPSAEAINLAIDMLSVNLGRKILDLVPGYVSTEVDIRLSFDSASSETRARRIIALYEVRGVRGWTLVPSSRKS